MSLELKRVEKKVGQDTHIYRTDLVFKKNTINILLGSTLAGKTTLMQIMAGLDKPTSGEIWFNGKDVTGKAVQKRNVSRRTSFWKRRLETSFGYVFWKRLLATSVENVL